MVVEAGVWFSQLKAWQVMVLGVGFFGGIYSVGALAMLTLTRLLSRWGVGRVLDARSLQPGQLAREWQQSAVSVLIFGVGLVVPWGLLQLGWAQLAPAASTWQVLLEVIFLLLWNEAHFWVNHRLLHSRRLLRYHGAHHKSFVTTPWSTYSFHPVEAAMLGSVILLPMLVHDFAFVSLALLPVLSLLLNLVGHSNWDLFPGVSDEHPLAASRRHHHHHIHPQGNYGFALPVMDWLMGTRVQVRHKGWPK